MLWEYIEHGFEADDEDGVTLRCHPRREFTILGPVLQAMAGRYQCDVAGAPFDLLSAIACPVLVTSSENSPLPIYRKMADLTARLIPGTRRHEFTGVGHCVPQEQPEETARQVRAFAVR